MNNEFTNKKFRKLLDKLQQDSWQLELLISGFAIFGLFSSLETIEIFAPLAQRLGMRDWQDQLEDLSFTYVNPEARKSVIDRLNYLNSKDENTVDEIRYELKKNLLRRIKIILNFLRLEKTRFILTY